MRFIPRQTRRIDFSISISEVETYGYFLSWLYHHLRADGIEHRAFKYNDEYFILYPELEYIQDVSLTTCLYIQEYNSGDGDGKKDQIAIAISSIKTAGLTLSGRIEFKEYPEIPQIPAWVNRLLFYIERDWPDGFGLKVGDGQG